MLLNVGSLLGSRVAGEGAAGAPTTAVEVSLLNDASGTVTPETEIVLTWTGADPGDGRAWIDAGTPLAWETSDTFALIGIDLLTQSAGAATLNADGDGGAVTDSTAITVPTIFNDGAGNWYTDASANSYIQ